MSPAPGRLRASRLAHQLLTPPAKRPTASVVQRMLAAQGQDFRAVCWAIGLRAGVSAGEVYAEFDRGAIVRSWPMRGTLHVVGASDLRWMLRLTAPRQLQGAKKRHADLGLDAAVFERAAAIATEVLAGGRALDRAEFSSCLQHAGIDTAGQRGYHFIWHLAMTGKVVWGPMRGDEQLLVLSEEWLPKTDEQDLSREHLLGRFLERYLAGHAPATLDDFAWWAGITKTDAGIGLAVARPRLAEIPFDGERFWMPADDADAGSRPSPAVSLLPGFDEYLLGYRDRSRVLAAEHTAAVIPGGNGVFQPLLVVRGEVVGTWRRAISRGVLRITPRPFGELSIGELDSLTKAAERHRGFLGLDAVQIVGGSAEAS